jgi:carbon storage regulator
MLVLSRKCGESITIGDNIEVTVVSVKGNQVKLSINAPREISILRNELKEKENDLK